MTRFKLSPPRRYVIVLESDGISDYMDDPTLMHYVMRLSTAGNRAGGIAQEVARSVTNRKGSDNGSCIVVFLEGQSS